MERGQMEGLKVYLCTVLWRYDDTHDEPYKVARSAIDLTKWFRSHEEISAS